MRSGVCSDSISIGRILNPCGAYLSGRRLLTSGDDTEALSTSIVTALVEETLMFGVLLDGFITGLLLQVAIGPVFFFILNTTIQKTILDGFVAVLAVTLVDYLYIFLAAIGVGRILERPKTRLGMQIVGSVVLSVFGVSMIISSLEVNSQSAIQMVEHSNPVMSFVSALLLTLSSPLTIIFWTSLFATKAIEKGYGRSQLTPFGLGAGVSTLVFLGLSVAVISLVRSSIPPLVVSILNGVVGSVLVIYGIARMVKGLKKRAVTGSPVDTGH